MKKYTPHFITAITTILVCGLFAYLVGAFPGNSGKLKIQLGNGNEVSMDIGSGSTPTSILLGRIFDHQDLVEEAKGFLENRHFYNVQEARFVHEYLQNLSPTNTVSLAIIDLKRNARGPFQETMHQVKVSFPDNTRISRGSAAVRRSSPYHTLTIELYNPKRETTIRLNANNSHSHPMIDNCELIQITKEDALDLFGNVPLSRTEDLQVTIIHN